MKKVYNETVKLKVVLKTSEKCMSYRLECMSSIPKGAV